MKNNKNGDNVGDVAFLRHTNIFVIQTLIIKKNYSLILNGYKWELLLFSLYKIQPYYRREMKLPFFSKKKGFKC